MTTLAVGKTAKFTTDPGWATFRKEVPTNYSSTGFSIISRMALSERIVSLEVTNGPCLLLTEWVPDHGPCSTLAFGDNGDQTNPNREGDFGGIVLMPMYWLKDQKLKLVGRYLYQKADQAEGLRLNSRYAPLADTRDSFIDLNSGRGDEHQAVYLGLNYYLCGENLKMISGIQHDELQSMGSTQYRGWTWGSSIESGSNGIADKTHC